MSQYQTTYRNTENGGEKYRTYQKEYQKKLKEQETEEARALRLAKAQIYRAKKRQEILLLTIEDQVRIKETKRIKQQESYIRNKFKRILKSYEDDKIN